MTESPPIPADIPELTGSDVRIVRHSFGGGSALFIMLALSAMVALVTLKMSMDSASGNNSGTAPSPALFSADEQQVQQAARVEATPPEDFALELAPPRETAADDAKLHEAVDSAFRTLDHQDARDLKLFLSSFGSNPYAIEQGYVDLARKAADSLAQEEEDEERRRRSEQQAVPWDMGVEPPKGRDSIAP